MPEFDVIIDDWLLNVCTNFSKKPADRKRIHSLINDFEAGEWRFNKFQSFIWDNIAECALSAKEREALIDKKHSTLVRAAQNLRLTDKAKDKHGKGSELAEIVLYGIMRKYYDALPVVPKIYYKQNAQDNAKGADSVHIVLEGCDKFSLWFGEAKFYNSIDDDRLGSIIQSVENSLQLNKLKKENSIITNVNNLDELLEGQPYLAKFINDALSSENSLDNLKPILHIPILLLHECSITSDVTELSKEYKANLIEFHKERSASFFSKQIHKLAGVIHKYKDIHFHLILFPVPDKEKIVNEFIHDVTFYKSK